MTTARALITRALKKVGVLGIGQDGGAPDYNDALVDLNSMMGVWNDNRWLVPALLDKTFTGTGATTYTIGPTGTIVVTKRPDEIETMGAFVRQLIPATANPVDYPMDVLQSYEDYNQIQLKTLNTIPAYLFYNPTMPDGTLYPWPLPSSNYAVHFLIKEILQRFANLDVVFATPDAYEEAILYNLVIRLNTSYPGMLHGEALSEVKTLAANGLAIVQASNTKIARLRMPNALYRRGNWNILAGP